MAKITGKNTRPGSNKATGRDYSKEKAYQSTPERNKYRAELNAEARERGIYGKRDAMGKDLSHKKNGKMVLESKSLNRRRQGANGKSTKK
jgi:hypothetical protein